MGHIVISCPLKAGQLKKKLYAHVVEVDEPVEEKENEDENSTK